jgi:hypothetical protein
MFSNSLKMIELDQNVSVSRQIVCKNIILSIKEYVGFIVWISWLGVASGLQMHSLLLVKI